MFGCQYVNKLHLVMLLQETQHDHPPVSLLLIITYAFSYIWRILCYYAAPHLIESKRHNDYCSTPHLQTPPTVPFTF